MKSYEHSIIAAAAFLNDQAQHCGVEYRQTETAAAMIAMIFEMDVIEVYNDLRRYSELH